MSDFTIEELPIPASLDSPGGDEFRASVDVRNAVRAHDAGTEDVEASAEMLLPGWLDPHEPKLLLVARVDGRIVARGVCERKIAEPTTAWMIAEVLPGFRGRGIGRALSLALEEAARAEGRSKAIVYAPSPETARPDGVSPDEAHEAEERVDAPTGFGSVPAHNPEVGLLLSLGYSLEQVVRGSRLTLPVDATLLDAAIARARAAAPESEYRLHFWVNTTPAEWRADIVHLFTRMSTDAPSAGLEEPEDEWTVERLLDDEKANQAVRVAMTSAVEHIATGRLVGFTEIMVPTEQHRAPWQEDTLVVREHRGHRLGLLLKAENLRQLHRLHPDRTAITTYNAEENRHMLDVNEALGFRPFIYEGAWRKTLSP
jgi:GNAT superfamily N-acetyltransferase